MMRFLLFSLLTVLATDAWAQQRTVTGRVTESGDRQPLPGVSVVLKGTTEGAITDAEGNYSISVPSTGGTLVFSFIGLKLQEVEIGERSRVDVQMEEDVTHLSEIVVTGYGEGQEKRMMTGSVTSVKGESFQDLPVQTFDRALQGRAAGVSITSTTGQPGGALSVRIRGIGSLSASNAPLYIVDGVQVSTTGTTSQGSSNPLASINPNDIEDIQILKDAASAAIYGAQSANGVVVITTKTGTRNRGTQIDFTAQEGVVQPHNIYDMLNGPQFANHWTEAQINSGLTPTYPWGNPSDSTVTDFDWGKNVFKNGRLRSYDLSIRGGDGKTSYLISGSYNKQEGQVINSDWQRFTGRINLTTRALDDKLTVNTKINVSHNRTWGTGADGNYINGPWIATFAALPTVPGRSSETGELIPYSVGPFSYNIINYLEREVRLGRTLGTVSSASASYKVMPGLTLSGLVGVDFSMNNDQNQRPSTIFGITPTASSSSATNRRTFDLNSNVTLDYSLSFGADEANTIKALVGYEYKSHTAELNGFTKTGFTNPYFTNLISQGSAFSGTGTSGWGEYKRIGYFAKVDYDYKEKYLLSGTIRRDGSSRFGVVNPYGTFWAGSFGWRLSSESFMEDILVISDLKLKAGYGIVGNSNIGNFSTITAFGSAGGQYPTNSGAAGTGLSITRLGNDAITWEKESIANIGVDFSLFNHRVSGSVEAWKKVNSDLLFSVPFLQSSGVRSTTITKNVGEMQNEGVDIEIGGIIIDQAFRWSTNFNVGTLKNTVTKLYDGLDTLTYTDGTPRLIVGRPSSFLYVTDFAGVNPANGMGMVYDKNGNLAYEATSIDDGRYAGTPIPKAYGGWSNTFSFKGITLDILFQYQFGSKVVNIDHQNFRSFYLGQVNQEAKVLDAWKQPGDVTSVPKVTTNAIVNGVDQAYFNSNFYYPSNWVSDASFIRLKSIILSYDVPSTLLSKAGLRSVRVFGMAYNLLTWTKYDGIDPEVVAGVNATAQGQAASIGNYPLGKQYSVGVSIGL